jgi:hypothetical protein
MGQNFLSYPHRPSNHFLTCPICSDDLIILDLFFHIKLNEDHKL